jgi:Concanavalin A-like lectin/glucanases superfamily/Protein of unknown function (DUF2793)
MPSSTGPNLGLPYGYTVGQSGWGDEVSAGLKLLDAVVNVIVIDVVDSLPGSPTNGDRYLLSPSAGGGNANKLAVRIGGSWEYYAPGRVGIVFDSAALVFRRWTGSAWDAITQPSGRPVAQVLDGDHEIVFPLFELSGNFGNQGEQGAGQDISTVGTCLVRRGVPGLFGNCPRVQNSGSPLTGSTYNPPGAAVTVEAWVRPQTAVTNHHIFNKSRLTSGQAGTASDTAFGLYYNSNRNVGFFIYSAGAAREALTSSTDLLLGVWNHLMGTYDGSVLRLYVNGVECVTAAHSGVIDFGAPGSLHLGAFPNVPGFGLNGDLGYVLVSSVVRDAAYAATAFRLGLPGITQAP